MRALRRTFSRSIKLGAIVLVAILPLNCENENILCTEKPNSLTNDYLPLMTGNVWNYSNSRVTVKDIVKVNHKEYYEVISESIVADTVYYTYKEYYRKTCDGKVFVMNTTDKREILKFDFNAPVNGSWTYNEDNLNHFWKVTKISNNMKVFVNNRQISNCMKFDYDLVQAVDDEHTIILAPGIGQIISQSYAWGISDTLQSALINGVEYLIK